MCMCLLAVHCWHILPLLAAPAGYVADTVSFLCFRRFQECLWGSEKKVADVDTQGVEDPKLFVWPGKGVYAVFGRKPEALGASPYCRDPIFVQFIVQVCAHSKHC